MAPSSGMSYWKCWASFDSSTGFGLSCISYSILNRGLKKVQKVLCVGVQVHLQFCSVRIMFVIIHNYRIKLDLDIIRFSLPILWDSLDSKTSCDLLMNVDLSINSQSDGSIFSQCLRFLTRDQNLMNIKRLLLICLSSWNIWWWEFLPPVCDLPNQHTSCPLVYSQHSGVIVKHVEPEKFITPRIVESIPFQDSSELSHIIG